MFESIFEWFDKPENIQLIKDNTYLIVLAVAGFIILIWLMWYFSSRRRRSHFRFHWHHLMYVIGVRKVMSRHWISRAHVHECFDPLVDFLPHKHIMFNEDTLETPNLIRKKVLFKLYKVADKLPEGVNLMVFKTFRSKANLNIKWAAAVEEVLAENPGMGRHEAMKLAKFKTEDPKDNMGGHETGGAVDVALCNDKGEIFDYGTRFHEYNDATYTKCHRITKEQAENRRKLVKLMKRQGFINFPAEWWHFSYGDRMWAAYKGRRHGGIFGSAETEMDGKYGFTVPVNRTIHEVRHQQ